MAETPNSDLRVSVIVPVRNGGEDIRALIERLEGQTLDLDAFEVVIGDDGSTDGGLDGLGTTDGRIRVSPGPPLNSYAARNRAVRESHAPVLAFCDADCRPEDDWLARGLDALQRTDVAAGRIRFSTPKRRSVWALIDMDGSKDHELQVNDNNAETANLFLRRDLFDRVGGFDDTITEHGDFDFVERCVAAGAHLSYVPEAVVWHPVRTTGRSVLRAQWIYSRGYAERATRDGKRPDGLKLRNWVPIVQPVRARRRYGKSVFGPDARWLAQHGVHATAAERAVSLPIMYLVVPYLRGVAQLSGWWAVRKRRR
jgi:glycosyltransferase involved in cell wall biosynthesis